MIANVIVGVRDIKRASAFYDALFATLGYSRVSTSDSFVGYSPGGKAQFWICLPRNGQPSTAGNGTQVSLIAKDTASAAVMVAIAGAAVVLGLAVISALGP